MRWILCGRSTLDDRYGAGRRVLCSMHVGNEHLGSREIDSTFSLQLDCRVAVTITPAPAIG